MTKYRVDCSRSRSTPIKTDDEVRVIGKKGRFRNLVRADKIFNKDTNDPICKCRPQDLTKRGIFWKFFDEKGIVLSVVETPTGFWFNMKV